MIISIIYEVFIAIEIIATLVFGVFLFTTNRNKTLSNIIQLICSIIFVSINVFQIPMQIQLGKSTNMSFLIIFIFFADSLIIAYNLGKNS